MSGETNVPLNPFVELARDPVAALAGAGWVVIYAGIVLLVAPYCVRKISLLTLIASERGRRQQRDWWGERWGGWLPDEKWIASALLVGAGLVVILWALGALVWVLK